MRKPYQDTTVWFKLFISVHPFPTTQLHRATLSYTCHVHTIFWAALPELRKLLPWQSRWSCLQVSLLYSNLCKCSKPSFQEGEWHQWHRPNDINQVESSVHFDAVDPMALVGGANQRVADHFWAVEVLCAPEGWGRQISLPLNEADICSDSERQLLTWKCCSVACLPETASPTVLLNWKACCSRLELPFLSIRTWWPSSRQDKLYKLEASLEARIWFWFCPPCKPSFKCQCIPHPSLCGRLGWLWKV